MPLIVGRRAKPANRLNVYPQECESRDVLSDGTRILVRPLKPEDAALYPAFASDVTLNDARLRFFAPITKLSEGRIAELTQLDYSRAMAFIAIEEATGEMLGVVRLHRDGNNGGEFAVIVRSPLKGNGLGWLLMQRMIAYAKAEALKQMQGHVLAENRTMLRMCEQLGFRIADDPTEPGVKAVTLPLEQPETMLA
jgi:acetyltransferase